MGFALEPAENQVHVSFEFSTPPDNLLPWQDAAEQTLLPLQRVVLLSLLGSAYHLSLIRVRRPLLQQQLSTRHAREHGYSRQSSVVCCYSTFLLHVTEMTRSAAHESPFILAADPASLSRRLQQEWLKIYHQHPAGQLVEDCHGSHPSLFPSVLISLSTARRFRSGMQRSLSHSV